MTRRRLFRSLRSRLIALAVVVQMLAVGAVVMNSERLSEEHLTRQFELRRGEITRLLQAALGPPMAQRDYGTVSETLRSAQKLQGITYLVMFDEDGRRVVQVNWERSVPLPTAITAYEHLADLDVLHTRIPILLSGQAYGELQIGMDLSFLHDVRATLRLQNLILAGVGMLLSGLLLGALTHHLTRRLGHLTRASQQLGAGQSITALSGSSDDDLGQVIQAFNGMATSLEKRMSDLQTAEARQRALVKTIDTERGRLDALLSAMRIGLVFVSNEQRVAYVNPSFCRLWTVEGKHLADDLPIEQLRQCVARAGGIEAAEEIGKLFAGDGSLLELTLADGRIITQHGVTVKSQAGHESGQLWLFEDITRERQTAQQLLFMAERDALTALANRSRFDSELERQMSLFARDPAIFGALIYFDLDEFKYINDTFGHRAGDNVLIRTADAIGKMIRSSELFARLGGDEFAIIAPGTDLEGAQVLAQRMLETIAKLSFEFDGRRFGLTISVGIALYPQHGHSAVELVSRADAAMYQAKRAGKNCWRLYRPELDHSASMLAQLGWNEKIQSALALGHFVLHYQGVHDCATRQIVHYEALVRMLDPDDTDNLLMPASFIPVSERSGRIIDIDLWVVRHAIQTLADRPDLPALSVNISGRSFDHPALTGTMHQLFDEFHVEPHRLIVELTETAALANMQDSERFIAELRGLGCTVCLDDFGVGFSSFAYLKHLSADVLKIDGMFIRSLASSKEDQVFVRAIVEVARGLGKKTVAEFVGDEATLQLLTDLGVDYAQGYHLSRPVPEITLG